ncbi:hypothetical protein [Micromonospora sp. CB01531]|uniref:hypothetical protein n=1 Tax=Micromonospora sp. CB01531 TaxID=1718947 RepID=UPI003FD5643E
MPRALAGYRAVDTDPVPEQVTTGYRHQVHDLAATLAEWDDPAVVTLNAGAARSCSPASTARPEVCAVRLRPSRPLAKIERE